MRNAKYVMIGTVILVVAGVLFAGCSSGETGRAGVGPARRPGSAAAPADTDTLVARREFVGQDGREQTVATSRGRGTEIGAFTGPVPSRGQRTLPTSATASEGPVISVSGSLISDGDEWILETSHETYQLGFGPPSYREENGIILSNGLFAEVRGRTAESGELEVLTCTTDGEQYTFRTEDGVAMWSGRFRMDSGPDRSTRALAGETATPSGRGRGGSRESTTDVQLESPGRRGRAG